MYDIFGEMDKQIDWEEKEAIALENGFDSWAEYEAEMDSRRADDMYKANLENDWL